MKWKKNKIKLQNGNIVEAQEPIIVSASRSTDIPAFYSDWFVERLRQGYVKWKNPFSGSHIYVSFSKTRLIVFWSKNPKPLIKKLDYLVENKINFYFQYTLNDYSAENIERKVGSVQSRIDTFIELSEKIGKEKVIWRFDPYILTKTCGVDELLKRTENIGNQLKNYTSKLVFSFADISLYKKVKNNLQKQSVQYTEFDENSMIQMASGLNDLNKKWNFQIATCAEQIDLNKYSISHNKCIDDDLMIKLFKTDSELMEFLGYEHNKQMNFFDKIDANIQIKKRNLKDVGQRESCGCIVSKDIGQYNTCPHECLYCYANTSLEKAKNNYFNHLQNRHCETIVGE